MKKYISLTIAVLALALGAYYSELRFLSYSHSPAPTRATSLAAQIDTLQNQGVTFAANNATSTREAGVDFTLKAGDQTYRTAVKTGGTVLDAMNILASSSDFRFTSKDFPVMGAFVESINGKRANDGYSWILYVNGTQAQKGISSVIVHSRNHIEWKYEKGY